MSAWEIIELVFAILNKIVVIGIALWMTWALQTVLMHSEWIQAYPFLGKWPVRLSVALIAAGFAIDALSVYTPSVSEVVMNAGILLMMHLFRRRYKMRRGIGPFALFEGKEEDETNSR